MKKFGLISIFATIVFSANVFSSELICPKSKKDFVIGVATPEFVKKCQGNPDSEKFLRDGKRVYIYEVDSDSKTLFMYVFDLSNKLLNASARSSKLSKEDAESLTMSLEKEKSARKARVAEEEKAQRVRLSREAALPPQEMYLQAGKYDRNGQQSDAVRLYELLIEKYPNHALAVQANNRLVVIRSENEASNRAYNESSQASAECRRRKEAYKNSCGSDSSCYTRAESICSE